MHSASFAYPQLDRSARSAVAEAMAEAPVPANTFVLSTCLRVEVAVPGDETLLKQSLHDLMGPLPAEPVIRHEDTAATHLFRVAAGLESPIVGEVEVLAQFRQALAALKATAGFDGGFAKVLESAVAVGREARTRLDSSPHDTVAAVAAQMVGAFPEVAVLGSGTMANAVVAALGALPAPPRVVLVARSPDKVMLSEVETIPMTELTRSLARYPAVVSATAAASSLLDSNQLGMALRGRSRRLLLVDMAMPPDFTPDAAAELDYVDIDDLAAMALRRPRTGDVEEMVVEAADRAHHRMLADQQVGPVISQLIDRADAVVDDIVARFGGRLADPSDREVLRQSAHTVARTILASPVKAMKEARDRQVVDTIAAAFRATADE